MKNYRYALAFIVLFIVSASVMACEINLKLEDETKESYSVGDELVIEVEVVYTHYRCHVRLEDTKFQYQGIEVLGATPWNKESDMKYTRKIKVKITEDDNNKSVLSARRICHKEGGYSSIEIKRE